MIVEENMERYLHHIVDSEKVINWFDFWPVFHDAEVLWFKLERGTEVVPGGVTIECLLHAWDLVAYGLALESEKHCLIHFRFTHCTDIQLEGFNQQNQMGNIEFTVEEQHLFQGKTVPQETVVISDPLRVFIVPEEILRVTFHPEFGMEGSFCCSQAIVVHVQGCDENGQAL